MCRDVSRENIVTYAQYFLHPVCTHMLCLYMYKHRHVSQGLSYPLAGSSFKLTMPNRDLSIDLLCHSLHRTTFPGKYGGFTFLDFRRLLAGM